MVVKVRRDARAQWMTCGGLSSLFVPESNDTCSFHRFGEILAKLIVRLPKSNTMNCPIMNACPKREPPPSPELCSAPVQTGLQN